MVVIMKMMVIIQLNSQYKLKEKWMRKNLSQVEGLLVMLLFNWMRFCCFRSILNSKSVVLYLPTWHLYTTKSATLQFYIICYVVSSE